MPYDDDDDDGAAIDWGWGDDEGAKLQQYHLYQSKMS
jgi:hypothetical protein